MKLHRVGKKADWDKLKSRNRNNWQRLAVRTHGVVTPGNLISVLGFGLVLLGLWHLYYRHLLFGISAIVIGRVLDIVDGMLAHKTGTKSPLGEVVDATIDKIEIAAALPVLISARILLPWQVGMIFVQHLANAIFATTAKWRGILMHTSRAGKYATTAQWGAIILYGLAITVHDAGWLLFIASVVFGVSMVWGLQAARGYAKKAFSAK